MTYVIARVTLLPPTLDVRSAPTPVRSRQADFGYSAAVVDAVDICFSVTTVRHTTLK